MMHYTNLLMDLGLSPAVGGFKYLDYICKYELFAEDSIMKVYDIVGANFNVSSRAVEHSIRYCLHHNLILRQLVAYLGCNLLPVAMSNKAFCRTLFILFKQNKFTV